MFLLNFILATSLSAYSGPDPARLLLLDASACRVAVSQKTLPDLTAADIAKFDQDRANAKAELEKQEPDAIKSGGGSAELENAIQAFYNAAHAYCTTPTSATDADYKMTKKALDEKLKAAGR